MKLFSKRIEKEKGLGLGIRQVQRNKEGKNRRVFRKVGENSGEYDVLRVGYVSEDYG